MNRRIALVLAVLLSVGCGGDGMVGTMGSFRVVDQDTGEPIVGAELLPVASNKPLTTPATTDAEGNGEYNFSWSEPVPEDQLRFQVKAAGYETLDVAEDFLTISATEVINGAPASLLELRKLP